MEDKLTLEKMKIATKLHELTSSVEEIRSVLFGEKGEKGVVGKLTDMLDLAKKIESILGWIAKLIVTALILGALPYVTEFINKITHH